MQPPLISVIIAAETLLISRSGNKMSACGQSLPQKVCLPVLSTLLLVISMGQSLSAQEPVNPIEVQGIRQSITQENKNTSTQQTDNLNKKTDQASKTGNDTTGEDTKTLVQAKWLDKEKAENEIREAKKKDGGPRRFAADLFDIRQTNPEAVTEGGVAEDYVLGTGDQLQLNVFGSVTFDESLTVDGKGEVVIPKIGTVKIAGVSLGKARQMVNSKINEIHAKSTAALTVAKLREVRVFILGEVYRSGSYLVPSLSSIVNVLSLSGGPTRLGTFRDIRIIRGGQVIHSLDLYPLRMDGKGNMNFYLQNGDTIFIPLGFNPVLLEGAFLRASNGEAVPKVPAQEKGKAEANLGSGLPDMIFELLPKETAADALRFAGGLLPAADGTCLSLRRQDGQGLTSVQDLPIEKLNEVKLLRGDVLTAFLKRERVTGIIYLDGWVRVPGSFARPEGLHLADLLERDHQVLPDTYLERGEVVRTTEDGTTSYHPFNLRQALARDPKDNLLLEDRDRIQIFQKEKVDPRPTVTFQDPFGGNTTGPLHQGMRVADLIHRSGIPKVKEGKLELPELYLRRGQLLRRDQEGVTTLLTFDPEKAFQGDPDQNLELMDKDIVTLFKVERMRLPEKVTLAGPFTLAGTFDLHKGMRVSDLVFMAGIPTLAANRYIAELARSMYGKPSVVSKLDLTPLLSSEEGSPLKFEDDHLNPLLEPDDVLNVYEKPEFRVHRKVRVLGQVQKPGTYILDREDSTLSDAIERAGGLTKNAMPEAGIFLRPSLGGNETDEALVNTSSRGLADILDRLNETKLIEMKAGTGAAGSASAPILFKAPVMHGISTMKLNRVVTDFRQALKREKAADLEVIDGDEIVIPKKTETAIVIGEVTTPFGIFDVKSGFTVGGLLKLAGGLTRNADSSGIRLLKADGRIYDSWLNFRTVEPGDALLVPQRIPRDTVWQDNLQALIPVALILNAIR